MRKTARTGWLRGIACRWVAWLAFMLASALAQAAAAPAVRVEVQARQPVLVGQQVRIEVTVVAPNFFLSAPPFPALEVPGAIITMPDERSIHGVEQDGGQTLATIQKSYVFTAQQPGDFTLPPVKIDFSYHGNDDKTQQASLTLPPTRISVQVPAGASASGAGAAVLPATRLVIHQRLDRDAAQLAAGDTLVRTVEIQAAGTPAMLIPPPHFEAPRGVRMYVADPVLRDSNGEGGGFSGGRRIERVTYVFEHSGRYTLPEVRVQWLDPQTQKPATVRAPAVTVQVKSGEHAGQRIAPELPVGTAPAAPRQPIDWRSLAIWLGVAVLLAALAWMVRRQWPRWRQRRANLQAVHAQSDSAMFEQALAACRAGDAPAAHRALLAWSQAHAQATPQAWAAQMDNAALSAQLEALQRHLYRGASSPAGGWAGESLGTALREAHRRWHASLQARAPGRAWGRPLGPLNPFQTGRS